MSKIAQSNDPIKNEKVKEKPKGRSVSMQFYFRQFAGDEVVMAMDLDAVGAHILLMCMAGASPNQYKIGIDERAIRMQLRNPSDEDFSRIKRQLLSGAWKISKDGNWWVQEGMFRTLRKQKEFSRKQSENAKKRDYAKPMPDSCQTDAKSMPSSSSESSPEYANNIITNVIIPPAPKGEIAISPKPDTEIIFPAPWNDEHKLCFEEWSQHRKEINKKLKPTGTKKLLKKYADIPDEFVARANYSMENSWEGLFPVPASKTGTNTKFEPKKSQNLINQERTFEAMRSVLQECKDATRTNGDDVGEV